MTHNRADVSGKALTLRPVGPGDGPMVERLFGDRGACGGCWCRYWHAPVGEAAWAALKGEPNRAALLAEIADGRCHAMLALWDGEPAGWCRFGPRSDFPKLMRSRVLATSDAAPWAVVCLYLPARFRGHGIGTALVRAATDEAFRRGAAAVEGYAVVPSTGSGSVPAAFAWTGVPALFEAAGFTAIDVDIGARRLYRRTADTVRHSCITQ